MSETQQLPIIIAHEGGVRFSARIRSHHVVVDQPIRAGGADTGPMPIELLGTALGTCIALYAQQFLHVRGLPYEGMRVEVEQHKVKGPSRIGEFVARVVLPVKLPAGYAEQLEQVARSCPVHNTLVHAAGMEVSIETKAAAAA
jgi:putative redox protein